MQSVWAEADKVGGAEGKQRLKGGKRQAVQSAAKHLLKISRCYLCPSPCTL